jgi:hypothetical protein
MQFKLGVGVYPKIGYYRQISLEVSTLKQKNEYNKGTIRKSTKK